MLKQKMAEKREMSKKRKAGNADEDAMTLGSSHSREELEKMLADETEALGGMVKDGDNMAPPHDGGCLYSLKRVG